MYALFWIYMEWIECVEWMRCAIAFTVCEFYFIFLVLRLDEYYRHYLNEHLQKNQDTQNCAYKTNENG